MTTVAVIPVKQLEHVKQRLGALLSADQRQRLFTAMFKDVLEAVTACDRIDMVIIVTSDDEVAELGRAYGAEIRAEPEPGGLTRSVTHIAGQLAGESVSRMIFVPADVPLISVEELEIVLDGIGLGSDPECLIVPSQRLDGSNCMVCSPPDAMTFGFGEDSFRRHLRLARDQGLALRVAKLPGIGLDIDTPEDLRQCAEELTRQALSTHTSRILQEDGISQELRRAG